MNRRTALIIAASGAVLLLAACGPGAGKSGEKGANPAMPPADPARAARTNGYDKDGKPIDAVAAAEMKDSDLPPLKGEGAGPPPQVEAPPPFEAPAKK